MTRREVQRERRRTERTMDEAFAALAKGDTVQALRSSRRARESGAMNPKILADHAHVARACGELDEAEDALRAAIATTPNFHRAFADLADLQWSRGKRAAALRLLARAVELAPADVVAAARLAAWRAELSGSETEVDHGDGTGRGARSRADGEPRGAPRTAPGDDEPRFTARTDGRDWDRIASAVAEHGFAVVRELLSAGECDVLHSAYEADDHAFEREERFDHEAVGRGRARWFRELPPWLAELRAELFARAVPVAERLRELLAGSGKTRRTAEPLPRTLAAWRRRHPELAASRPTARLYVLPPGGSVASQRTEDRRAFPLRALLDLGPGAAPVRAFARIDQRPGKKVRESRAATRRGDAVLFCCRERLDFVGGAAGLQLVRWSLGPVPPDVAERWLLDLPFDESS